MSYSRARDVFFTAWILMMLFNRKPKKRLFCDGDKPLIDLEFPAHKDFLWEWRDANQMRKLSSLRIFSCRPDIDDGVRRQGRAELSWKPVRNAERGERQRDLGWHFDGTSPGQWAVKPTSDVSPGPGLHSGSDLESCHRLSVSCALCLSRVQFSSPATFCPIKQYPAQNILAITQSWKQ